MDPASDSETNKESQITSQPSAPAVDTARINRLRRRVFLLGGSVIILAAISALVWAFFYNQSTSSTRISDQFVNDLQKKDASSAHKLFSEAGQKSMTEIELDSVFQSVSAVLQGNESLYSSKIESRNNKTYSIVVYKVSTKKYGDKYIRIVMEKNDGKWQILNFLTASQKLDAKIEN